MNSAPVFRAWQQGAQRIGWQVTVDDWAADVAVIWSMLWRGRMRGNREVWQAYRGSGRPVIVLEVGMLQRGMTWKMGVNGTTASASWITAYDPLRPSKIGIQTNAWRQRGDHVLIALQRSDSEQWRDLPATDIWLQQTLSTLSMHTDRAIRIRPHPRQRTRLPVDAAFSIPRILANTYDSFDLQRDFDRAWAVINVNSGPGSQAIISGVPAFVHADSLAAPVANLDLCQIENPRCPDREQWLTQLSHTEWTISELQTGEPQSRLPLH